MSKITIRCVFMSDAEAMLAKSHFLIALSGEPLPEDYEPTIFKNYKHDFQYNGQNIEMHLWDTSGQEEYDRLRPMSYAKCDIAVLIFSLNNKKTLTNLDKYVKEVKEYADNSVRILVGINLEKKDDDDDTVNDPVSDSEIEEWAQKNGMNATLKHTLKSGENMDKVFDFFAENYIAIKKKDKQCNIA